MTQALLIHPDNPQMRLIRMVTEGLHQGQIIAYPTDSNYALGCQVGDKQAMDRIRQIRGLDKQHKFTLMCRDLSDISLYAKVDNSAFRFIKAHTPGPFTFVLPATNDLPKRLQESKRKTIGIYVPSNKITQIILEELNAPLITTSLILPEQDIPLTDPSDIYDACKGRIDFLVDGGNAGLEPTTVIDLTGQAPTILRQGKGLMSEL